MQSLAKTSPDKGQGQEGFNHVVFGFNSSRMAGEVLRNMTSQVAARFKTLRFLVGEVTKCEASRRVKQKIDLADPPMI